jgi:uncharacterized paraquat-inducible protein A
LKIHRRLLPAVIAGVAALVLTVGLTAPLINYQPKNNVFTKIMGSIDPRMAAKPKTFNAIQTISSLWNNKEYILALLFLSGSVIIPYLRFALYFYACWGLEHGHGRAVAFSEHVSRYCLLDVMALALFVGSLSQMPGAYYARLEWGIYPIIGSVIIGMVPPLVLPSEDGNEAQKKA